jgi:hypothetical protein
MPTPPSMLLLLQTLPLATPSPPLPSSGDTSMAQSARHSASKRSKVGAAAARAAASPGSASSW